MLVPWHRFQYFSSFAGPQKATGRVTGWSHAPQTAASGYFRSNITAHLALLSDAISQRLSRESFFCSCSTK
jgi:hypothetical protein